MRYRSLRFATVRYGSLRFATVLALLPAFSAQGVEVVSLLSSQKTATQIATRLVDTSTGMSLVQPANPTDPDAPSFRIRVDQSGTVIPTVPQQIGEFDLGMEDNLGTYENRPLPPANQLPGGPTAVYAGGLPVQSGVVLSTGMVSTDDYDGVLPPGYGAGVEGPNNGTGGIGGVVPGELSFIWDAPADFDFNQASPPGRDAFPGDAAVITFVVNLPNPGFIRIKFVFGSDEHPAQPVEIKDDGFLVFVDGQNTCTLRGDFNETGEILTEPFALKRLRTCEAPIFLENLIVPWPEEFFISDHGAVATTLHYNHEFAGFTPVLTRETGDCPETPALETIPLAPGHHTIKIVIQDVHDVAVDSAVFIPDNGITYFPITPGDFTLDGFVDISDFNIWNTNKFQTDKKFTEGDANFDGVVDASDFNIWNTHKFTGDGTNAVLAADFDGDGDVDCADYAIWQKFAGLQRCASRFEGDATGDGAVDGDDLVIWESLSGMTAGDCND